VTNETALPSGRAWVLSAYPISQGHNRLGHHRPRLQQQNGPTFREEDYRAAGDPLTQKPEQGP